MPRQQWKWLRGDHYTVDMVNSSTATTGTYHPVSLDRAVDPYVIKEPDTAGDPVFGVCKPLASGGLTKTQVIVSEDMFQVRCSGDLQIGAQVMVETDNAVSQLITTGATCCGIVVDYDPIAWTGGTPGLCIIKARFSAVNEGIADTYGLLSALGNV